MANKKMMHTNFGRLVAPERQWMRGRGAGIERKSVPHIGLEGFKNIANVLLTFVEGL